MVKRQKGLGMEYKKLIFEEMSEERTAAFLLLGEGHKVSVTFDLREALHDCELRNSIGSLIDSAEGLDSEGVEEFIKQSKDYVEEYVCIMNDMLDI